MTGGVVYELNTWSAKRIIGDSSASAAAQALLQTGEDVATDIWILNRTNRASLYGIKYKYDNNTNGTEDKIELYGGYTANAPTAWIQLDTGDLYVLGNVGIGHAPETYKLYVNGTSYLGGNTTIQGNILPSATITYNIGSDSLMWNDAHIRGIGVRHIDAATQTYVTDGQLHIGYGSVAPTKAIYLYYSANTSSRTKFFEVNSNGAYAPTRFGVNGQNTSYALYVNGTTGLAGGHLYLTGAVSNSSTGNTTQIIFGTPTTNHVAISSNTGIVIINPTSATTTGQILLAANGNSAFTAGTLAINTTAQSGYTLSVNGTGYFTGNVTISHTASADMAHSSANPKITFSENGTQPVHLIYTDWDAYRAPAGLKVVGDGNTSSSSPAWFEVEGDLHVKRNLHLYRQIGAGYGTISFYLNTYKTWKIYMSNAVASGCPSGGTPSTLGDVTNWALRSYIENASGYGWIWESAAESNTGTPTARMALNSNNGNLTLTGSLVFTNSGTAFRGINYGTMGDNDQWRIGGAATGANAGYMELATADDGNEPIYVRQYTGVFSTVKRTLTLLDANGYSYFPSYINIGGHEKNASSPSYVWGSNSSDNFLRSYQTAYLNVNSASYLRSRGNITCETGTTRPAVSGVSMSQVYNNGYPTTYGNALTLNGGGCGQLLIGWSGTSGARADAFLRSKRDTSDANWSSWYTILDSGNYTSYTVTKTGSGASGTWGISITGNSDTVDNYHASGLWRSDGATWNPNANVTCNATANGQEWSFDLNAGSYTGTYWHVWSSKNGASILQCYTDNRHVAIPVHLYVGGYNNTSYGLSANSIAVNGSILSPAYYTSGSPGSNCYLGPGNGDGNGNGTANIVIRSWYGVGFMNGCTAAGTNGAVTAGVDCRSGHIYANAVHNAVWNDYAECRKADIIEGGYCVTETPDGSMMKTTERLQPGCKLTSDTYGSIMGETDEAKTPIAVAGRVLVYPYHNRNDYPLGAAVCSAPNGTIDIMTRDEIIMYPERIVGTVSEIPTYTIWRAGGKDTGKDIEVKGRIWIYVK